MKNRKNIECFICNNIEKIMERYVIRNIPYPFVMNKICVCLFVNKAKRSHLKINLLN